MTPKSQHDQIEEQLAKALKTTYNRGKGVDIKKPGMAAEAMSHACVLYFASPLPCSPPMNSLVTLGSIW